MKPVTAEQIKHIHAILPERYKKDKELKQSLVYQFTEDPEKISTKDLNYYQAEELIYFLKTGKVKDQSYYANFNVKNKQHMYILSLCHQIGWEVYSDVYRKLVVDLSALGGWLYKYGYLHKALMEYTESELPKLVTQFENMAKYKSKQTV